MRNFNIEYCSTTKKFKYPSEAKAVRALNRYDDIKRVYFCSECQGFHTSSQTLSDVLETGELSFEEENKLLREKINKLEDLTTSVTRVEIISKDSGREIVIKSEDIELSFQDDMRTMKVFYGFGKLDELKHF